MRAGGRAGGSKDFFFIMFKFSRPCGGGASCRGQAGGGGGHFNKPLIFSVLFIELQQ